MDPLVPPRPPAISPRVLILIRDGIAAQTERGSHCKLKLAQSIILHKLTHKPKSAYHKNKLSDTVRHLWERVSFGFMSSSVFPS